MTRAPNLNFMGPFMLIEKLLGSRIKAISGNDPPRHLYYLSPHTASALIEKCGFSVVGIAHGKPVPLRSPVLHGVKHGLTALAEVMRILTNGRWLWGPAIAIYARKIKDISEAGE